MNKSIFLLLIITCNQGDAGQTDQQTKLDEMYQKAVTQNQAGLLVEASTLLTQAITIDDTQPQFFHQRGLSFMGMGQTEEGIKDLKQAADLKSQELSVYLTLIKYYNEKSQYMLVLIMTDQMIANLPEQAAGAYYDKGKAYEALNKPQLAIKAYRASINELGSDQQEFTQLLENRIKSLTQGGTYESH